MTAMSTTVILAFFVGMLFRDICLYVLVRMARKAKERGMVTVDGKKVMPVTNDQMEALAKAIVDRTMLVEMDEMDGMLYCYRKADGQFLAQAPDMDKLSDMLRQRYGAGRHYIIDDDRVINT